MVKVYESTYEAVDDTGGAYLGSHLRYRHSSFWVVALSALPDAVSRLSAHSPLLYQDSPGKRYTKRTPYLRWWVSLENTL